jgi:hypothetical protein
MTGNARILRLAIGTLVKTTQATINKRCWSEEAQAVRKWGVFGEVVGYQAYDDVFYNVKHNDGSVGFYDLDELETIPEKYTGVTREQLASHADEGWALANKRTEQLREAIEALRGADFVIQAWGMRLEEETNTNVNLKKMYQVLVWANCMFPEEEK